MNARQAKKRLKKHLAKLKSEIQDLYDAYTRTVHVEHRILPIEMFKTRRIIPEYISDNEEMIERTKQTIAKDLFKDIKENIIYEIDKEYGLTSITGIIFVGRK